MVPRMDVQLARQLLRLVDQISTIVVGKRPQIEDCVACLLAGGHLLIEDVPGVGKTTLAHTLASSLGLGFRRVQFTADLMPSDLIGVSVFERAKDAFVFHPGPVFAQVLLADEINRAGPRTQSALLEAMQEGQVTADGCTMPLAPPFLVLATQNPIELEGTFPLPEAQLDRFLMRLDVGYPDAEQERAILRRFRAEDPLEALDPVLGAEELLSLSRATREVYVHPALEGYLIALARATRAHEGYALGISPRGTLALYHACQALAALRGRAHVLPDDAQELVEPVWAHRLLLSSRRRLRGEDAQELLRGLIASVPVPVEERWSEAVEA